MSKPYYAESYTDEKLGECFNMKLKYPLAENKVVLRYIRHNYSGAGTFIDINSNIYLLFDLPVGAINVNECMLFDIKKWDIPRVNYNCIEYVRVFGGDWVTVQNLGKRKSKEYKY